MVQILNHDNGLSAIFLGKYVYLGVNPPINVSTTSQDDRYYEIVY